MKFPKNQIVRNRGSTKGEAGADWSFGFGAKPEADEHRKPAPKQQDAAGSNKDGLSDGRDDLGFPPNDESRWG